MFRNILVPTDGSAPSRRAIKRAVQLAREQKARITGFYVGPAWRLPVQAEFVPVEVLSPKEHDIAVKKAATRILGAVKNAAAAARVRCLCYYVMGEHPYAEIVKAAKRNRCDLIVSPRTAGAGSPGCCSAAKRPRCSRTAPSRCWSAAERKLSATSVQLSASRISRFRPTADG